MLQFKSTHSYSGWTPNAMYSLRPPLSLTWWKIRPDICIFFESKDADEWWSDAKVARMKFDLDSNPYHLRSVAYRTTWSNYGSTKHRSSRIILEPVQCLNGASVSRSIDARTPLLPPLIRFICLLRYCLMSSPAR